jgi:hypothetical protein
MLRRIELVAGLGGGIVGLVGLLLFAFATGTEESMDVSSSGGATVTSSQETPPLIEEQTGPVVRILVIGIPLLAAVTIGAWRHARNGSTGGGLLLIAGTIQLWIGAILGAFSVGLYVFPAAVLALVSLIACGLGRDTMKPALET